MALYYPSRAPQFATRLMALDEARKRSKMAHMTAKEKMMQGKEIAEKKMALTERGLDLTERGQNITLRGQAQAAELAEKKRLQKIAEGPFHKQPVKLSEIASMEESMPGGAAWAGVHKPFFDELKNLAVNENLTKEQLASRVFSIDADSATPKNAIVEKFYDGGIKQLDKMRRNMINDGFTEQADIAAQYMDKLAADKPNYATGKGGELLATVFQNTLSSMKFERDKEMKVDQFSEPFKDEYGNIVQRNMKTGKLSKVAAPTKGMEITTADGTVIRTGVTSGAAGMRPKTKNTLEDRIIAVKESKMRLKTITDTFQKKYLNIGKRLGYAVTGWKQKLEGTTIGDIIGKADPKKLKESKKYWEWRQNSIGNLNKEIKWLTGAAMNKSEVPRLMKEVPNPGLGLFDGDAPDQFETKLENKLKQTNTHLAGYIMMLKQGLTDEKIKEMGNSNLLPTASQIKTIINNKAKELEEGGMEPGDIPAALQQIFFEME